MNEIKSEIPAETRHKILTPLHGIIGLTDLASDNPSDEVQKDYPEILKSSGKFLLSTINDVLDFSKIEAGLMTF